MPSTAPDKGLALTPASVGFLLSLIALITFAWNVVGYVKTAELKDEQHDAYIAEDKQTKKEILNEMKVITRKVDELTFIVKGFDLPSKHALYGTPEIE